jgi:hypothetical protein
VVVLVVAVAAVVDVVVVVVVVVVVATRSFVLRDRSRCRKRAYRSSTPRGSYGK